MSAFGSKADIDKLLLSLDKQKSKLEAKESGGDKPEAGGATVGNGPNKCMKIIKEIQRIESKIAEHERANNEKKVVAYTKKRKKSEAALEELKKRLAEDITSGRLDEAAQEALKKELEAAGCPL